MTDKPQLREAGRLETRCEDCALFNLCFAQDLSNDERDQLNSVLKRQQPVERGEHLFHGGQPLKSVTVVRSGSVKSYQISQDGDEIVSGFYLPGEIIGLDGMSKETHPGFAVALEESRTCDIPFRDFMAMLDKSPKLNQVMLKLLAEEMTETRELLLVVGRLDAKTRVALFLLSMSRRLARRNQDPDKFRLTMDRRDIANYLGLTIETVSRTLSAMQKDGVISVRGKMVHILDREELRELAHQMETEDDASPAARRSSGR
ncbi:fumarate/nitrate reduction transcriptional regulator Fnr [Wenzhouxiangella marina]|uniref:Fumarate and nitrate reduction regulatory protein n=1 Tax=Wenzhouxiangella marina TaxID=1579979 RepID=A0A0K0XZM2_9GAMM|nr:fumarate/nitrate reduction transcriptional regulator Fnr [Wenzhouxiangella marina]AKS43120.1 Fumarate and nitrate reduction regulatory protein [Wenzhouxiangella marina]MBB6087195.1 CRP/FNR family transcriptional regulator [Wenzhouxiangella marina]